MIEIFSAVLISLGLYRLLIHRYPHPYKPAIKVLNIRLEKRMTSTEMVLAAIGAQIQPYIHLEHLKRTRLEMTLKNLGHTMTPEQFEARAIAEGVLMATAFVWLPFLSVPLGLSAMALTGFSFYKRAQKILDKELLQRREQIERELPQFASTIRQTLNSTRDIIAILANYRKICGSTLASEIDKTLNEILTGNTQAAINALGLRVASSKMEQLTRGLQAVLRGDDQKVYFDLLAQSYRKSQDERVEQELQNRPKQLYPYLGVLFACLIFMIIASVGADIVNQMNNLF